MKRNHLPAALAAVLLFGLTSHSCGLMMCAERDAHAVIGRPLTPMSYAGVARRTARRTTRRSLYYGGGYYGGGAYGYGVGAITALPAGCGFGAGIYTCGAVRYRPYYQGTTVVYHVVE
jgi:hypothetical protein